MFNLNTICKHVDAYANCLKINTHGNFIFTYPNSDYEYKPQDDEEKQYIDDLLTCAKTLYKLTHNKKFSTNMLEENVNVICNDEDIFPHTDNKSGLMGYVNWLGKWVIPAVFEEAEEFIHGCATVSIDGAFGRIDKTGHFVIPYTRARSVEHLIVAQEDYFLFDTNSGYILMDENGNTMFTCEYGYIREFENDDVKYVKVGVSGDLGVLNLHGDIIVPIEYDNINVGKMAGKNVFICDKTTYHPLETRIFVLDFPSEPSRC